MAIGKQLSDGNPDGTSLGLDSTDKISLYGKTAVVQATFIASLGTTSTTTSMKTALNRIRVILRNLGAMAAT
jgi:hypothetical protein